MVPQYMVMGGKSPVPEIRVVRALTEEILLVANERRFCYLPIAL